MNYMGNAIKFTRDGQIVVLLELEKVLDSPKAALLNIQVRDTGCGISEEDMLKLFAPFTMLDANKHLNPNGTGMGLNICKQIAERMGGEVWVRSFLTKGSIFGFSFKCDIPDKTEIEAAGFRSSDKSLQVKPDASEKVVRKLVRK